MDSKQQTKRVVRPAAVAGSWYPGPERELRRTISGLLGNVARPELRGRLLGLIVPHAGYAYSGPTAAHAYTQLTGESYDRVLIVGPSHRAFWREDFAVAAATHYETPLGLVEVDGRFIDRLAQRVGLGRVRRDEEHSLEIQLPFLQVVLGEFRLVPVMISSDDAASARRLGEVLGEMIQLQEGSTLLVASTDLHHISDYAEVVRRDQVVVDALTGYDMQQIQAVLTERGCSVCGRMPVLAVLEAARAVGADHVQVLHQTTSGDVTGDRRPGQYTVGYLAAAVVASGL